MEWISTYIPGYDPEGKPIVSVIAKRTYALAPGKVTIADEQFALFENDILADPGNLMYSEILAESDYLPYKPFTDVVVIGRARVPKGKRAYHIDCEVFAGKLHKTVRVYGERKLEHKALRGVSLTDPQPFTEQPIGYSYAYGGIAKNKEGALMAYYPNPLGRGFTLKNGFDDYDDIKIPHCEDPDSPITGDSLILDKYEQWPDAPKPASFGFTRKNFYPRYTYAGVLPEYLYGAAEKSPDMQKAPRMDARVYQGASDGLWGTPLIGNEPVRLTYLDEEYPAFEFSLPADYPIISLNIGKGPVELSRALHTVVIDKENNTLQMVWRGALPYGGLEELATLTTLEAVVR